MKALKRLKPYLLLFVAVCSLYAGFRTSDRLILPSLHYTEAHCQIGNLENLKESQNDKFVVFLDVDNKEIKDDFLKWVDVAYIISEQIAIKTISYIHISNCDSKYLDYLRSFSMLSDHLILVDTQKEFLRINGIKDSKTFSALLNHNNESLFSSKDNYFVGIVDQYNSEVKRSLEIELPFVDYLVFPNLDK